MNSTLRSWLILALGLIGASACRNRQSSTVHANTEERNQPAGLSTSTGAPEVDVTDGRAVSKAQDAIAKSGTPIPRGTDRKTTGQDADKGHRQAIEIGGRMLNRWVHVQNEGNWASYQKLYDSQNFEGIKRTPSRGVTRMNYAEWMHDRKRMFRKQMEVEADNVDIPLSTGWFEFALYSGGETTATKITGRRCSSCGFRRALQSP